VKLGKVPRDTRVIILAVALVLGLFMLHPNPFASGLVVRSVLRDGAAYQAGLQGSPPTLAPMSRERILRMNAVPMESLQDYYAFLETLTPGATVLIKTTVRDYRVALGNFTREVPVEDLAITLPEESSNASSQTRTIDITAEEALGLRVSESPTSNIRLGLDLQGGTRVLLRPEEQLDSETLAGLLDNMKERLNVYGLSDVVVRTAGDLSGNTYILVEIAGANEEEVKELLARQGKFEAKVGNISVFRGGNDITYVCRTADCSGIDPRQGCGPVQGGEACRFYFQISLTPAAAQRQADATANLTVVSDESGEPFLSEKLDLYLDDNLVSSLSIGASLRGSPSTEISISGSGLGLSREAAIDDSLENMRRLQTILITGSLPVKLEIMKTDSISPALGKAFLKNTLLVGAIAIFAVALVILIRYRKPILVIPILIVNWAEIYLLLAVAAIIGWNLDVASIAGIIIMIGTGVNDQIVITDETLRGETGRFSSWKERLKKAFFIVFAAYFTTVGSMIPLLMAGAGLLKGFAVTTILGVSIGVLITRPAYANVIQYILGE